jgi:hypothetical protein
MDQIGIPITEMWATGTSKTCGPRSKLLIKEMSSCQIKFGSTTLEKQAKEKKAI